MTRPLAIDLFAGVGGMTLGFEQAGFDVRAAVEIDPIHCAVHTYNFPDCAIIPKSVAGVSAATVRAAAGLFSGEQIDVVFGGPPCQGFSMIGHRAIDDPRNRLVLDFVRLVSELKANYFVFENVKGLTVGRHSSFLAELVAAFQKVGYDVQLPWRVVDAASFGVPQHRERLVLMGAKRGLPLPSYPQATTYAADEPEQLHLRRGPSAFEAIGDLPNADDLDCLLESDVADNAEYGTPSDYAVEMRCLSDKAWHHGYRRDWQPERLTSSWRTEHTDISQARFAATDPGTNEPISRFFKLKADGLSNTLRAGTDGSRGAFTSPRPIHYEHPRCITVREMARLHGFPDWFRLHWTKWHGAREIGNAVPPPLARAIASEIMLAASIEATKPPVLIALGDENLLYSTLSSAAEFLGVKAPSQRRDRKSGAKKRSQQETEAARLAML